MREGPTAVLDASALLALIHAEPGSDVVETVIEESVMSTVNWSEVIQKLLARGTDVEGVRTDMEELGLRLEDLTVEDAEAAAAIWAEIPRGTLSLADRCCLALARRLRATAVTADRAWAGLGLDVTVRTIR